MDYDAIVIGAGHNGLAAAVRLSEKGWRVAVVEAATEPGGAVKTREATLPGFRHDIGAMNLSMFAGSPFFAAHREALLAHGVAFAPAEHCFASVFRDDSFLGVSKTLATTLAAIAALSAKDADAWTAMLARFGADAPHLFGLLGSPIPSWSATKVVWNAWRAQGTGWLYETLKLLVATPRDFWRRTSSTQSHRDDGRLGPSSRLSPGRRGRRAVSLSGRHGQPELRHDDWTGRCGYDRQGDGWALKAKRGELLLGERVAKIDVGADTATGVTLASGKRLTAKTVIANVHPKIVFGELVPRDAGRARFERGVERFRAGPGTMMIHLALNDLPDCERVRRCVPSLTFTLRPTSK